jgi:hypothetical protein
MMAPAIIGMLFNSDRRQTPSLVDSARSVIEPSLHCAEKGESKGENRSQPEKVPGSVERLWLELSQSGDRHDLPRHVGAHVLAWPNAFDLASCARARNAHAGESQGPEFLRDRPVVDQPSTELSESVAR